MNGGPADVARRDLGKAEAGLQPCLADRAFANGYSFAASFVAAVEHGGNHTATLDKSEPNLTAEFTGWGRSLLPQPARMRSRGPPPSGPPRVLACALRTSSWGWRECRLS